MTDSKPEISIIIPCRNEEKYIRKIVEDIIKYNRDMHLEIIVVDGMSTDKTRDIVKELAKMFPDMVRLLENPARYVPHALNIGIKHARGDILIRMDAHAIYPPDYIKKLTSWLKKTDAWNVGPVVEPVPAGNSIIQKAIAVAQKSLFGVGNSLWRRGVKKPLYVDTVPYFCMEKKHMEKVGLFNELLVRNQDAEYNARILKLGGKILLVPAVKIKWITRDSLIKLAKQYFQYGYYRAMSAKILGKFFSFRQLIPPIFFLTILFFGLLSLFYKLFLFIFVIETTFYLLTNLLSSLYETIKQQNISLFFYLPISYIIIHFSFGTGFLKGYIECYILKRQYKKQHNA